MNSKFLKKNKVKVLISISLLFIVLVLSVKFIKNYTKKENFILHLHKDPSFINGSHSDKPTTTTFIENTEDSDGDSETRISNCQDLFDKKSICSELKENLDNSDVLDLCYTNDTAYRDTCSGTCSQLILNDNKKPQEKKDITNFLKDPKRNKLNYKTQTDLVIKTYNCELGDICSSNIPGRESNNICEERIKKDKFKSKCNDEINFKACPKRCYNLIQNSGDKKLINTAFYKEYENTCV